MEGRESKQNNMGFECNFLRKHGVPLNVETATNMHEASTLQPPAKREQRRNIDFGCGSRGRLLSHS
jgi:hypothetical protein